MCHGTKNVTYVCNEPMGTASESGVKLVIRPTTCIILVNQYGIHVYVYENEISLHSGFQKSSTPQHM